MGGLYSCLWPQPVFSRHVQAFGQVNPWILLADKPCRMIFQGQMQPQQRLERTCL